LYTGVDYKTAESGHYREIDFTDELRNNTEYAVYGWFRFEQPSIRREEHCVFRLSSNKPNGNFENPGDVTLGLFVQQESLAFITYNIDNNLSGNDNTRDTIEIDYGNDLEAWIFFYWGYERKAKSWSLYVRFQDHTERISGSSVHFSPNTFNLFVGDDGLNDVFKGRIQGLTVEAG
jgi:hypothetical protein